MREKYRSFVRNGKRFHSFDFNGQRVEIDVSSIMKDKEKLVKVQQNVRAYLARKHTKYVETKSIQDAIKEMNEMDHGFTQLIGYSMLLFFFLVSFLLRANVYFSYTVNKGIENFMADITFNDDLTYSDVKSPKELQAFLEAFYTTTYLGDEEVELCNTCIYYDCMDGGCYNQSSSIYNTTACMQCQDITPFCANCTDYTVSIFPGEISYSEDDVSMPETCGHLSIGMTNNYREFITTGKVEASTTAGWIANENHVIGGALVKWTTYMEQSCVKQEMDELYASCYSETKTVEEDICPSAEEFYDLSCFEYEDDVEANVAMFDLGVYNLGFENGLCQLKAMNDENVFEAAKEVVLTFITLNGQEESTFSLTTLTFVFELGGHVDIDAQTESFPLRKWNATELDITIFAMMNFFGLYMILYAGYILMKMLSQFHKKKKDHSLDGTSKQPKPKLRRDLYYSLRDGSLEFVSNLCFTGTYIVWAVFLAETSEISYLSELDTISEATTDNIIYAIETIERVQVTEAILNILFMISALIGLLKLLRKMTFHKRLSLIIDVLIIGAKDLLHYFIIFFVVVVIFCNIGLAFLGPYSDKFKDFKNSFVSLVRIGLGEPGNLYDEFLEYAPTFGVIFMVAYQGLVGLVLLNVLISICVESFAVYKSGLHDNYDTVNFSFLIYLLRLIWIGYSKLRKLTSRKYRAWWLGEEARMMQKMLDKPDKHVMSRKEASEVLAFFYVPYLKRRKIFKIMVQKRWAEYESKAIKSESQTNESSS